MNSDEPQPLVRFQCIDSCAVLRFYNLESAVQCDLVLDALSRHVANRVFVANDAASREPFSLDIATVLQGNEKLDRSFVSACVCMCAGVCVCRKTWQKLIAQQKRALSFLARLSPLPSSIPISTYHLPTTTTNSSSCSSSSSSSTNSTTNSAVTSTSVPRRRRAHFKSLNVDALATALARDVLPSNNNFGDVFGDDVELGRLASAFDSVFERQLVERKRRTLDQSTIVSQCVIETRVDATWVAELNAELMKRSQVCF